MSKARLVLTALFVDRQTPTEVAQRYGVHRSWVYRLKARFETDGEAAFEPRSRRPKSSPTAIGPAAVDLIVELREKLGAAGLDAGPDTIAWHSCIKQERLCSIVAGSGRRVRLLRIGRVRRQCQHKRDC